jgi:hypothetical protein
MSLGREQRDSRKEGRQRITGSLKKALHQCRLLCQAEHKASRKYRLQVLLKCAEVGVKFLDCLLY